MKDYLSRIAKHIRGACRSIRNKENNFLEPSWKSRARVRDS